MAPRVPAWLAGLPLVRQHPLVRPDGTPDEVWAWTMRASRWLAVGAVAWLVVALVLLVRVDPPAGLLSLPVFVVGIALFSGPFGGAILLRGWLARAYPERAVGTRFGQRYGTVDDPASARASGRNLLALGLVVEALPLIVLLA